MKRSREPEEHPSESAIATIESTARNGLKQRGAGDGETSPRAAKITELDPSSDKSNGSSSDVSIRCSLPPHKEPLVCASYSEYETHYRAQHTNRCAQCRKNFPSTHLLDLHIEETHDSFVQARRDRGERTYSCFVEGCEKKCSTPQKRRMHLIDKHMYPKDFFFAVTRDGIDGRRSLLREGTDRRARPRTSQEEEYVPRPAAEERAVSTETGGIAAAGKPIPAQQPDQDMEDLSDAVSALRFVPMSVRFGRGRAAGFAKR